MQGQGSGDRGSHELTVQSVCVSSVLLLQTRSLMTSRDPSPETRTPFLRISCLHSSVSNHMINWVHFFFRNRLPAPLKGSAKKINQKVAPGVGSGRRSEMADGTVCAYIVRRKAPDVASCGQSAPERHKAACCKTRRAGPASSARNCHNSRDEANPLHSPPTPLSLHTHSHTLHLPACSHFGWRNASIHLETSASIKDKSESLAPTLSSVVTLIAARTRGTCRVNTQVSGGDCSSVGRQLVQIRTKSIHGAFRTSTHSAHTLEKEPLW